jgi:hypothetical protein
MDRGHGLPAFRSDPLSIMDARRELHRVAIEVPAEGVEERVQRLSTDDGGTRADTQDQAVLAGGAGASRACLWLHGGQLSSNPLTDAATQSYRQGQKTARCTIAKPSDAWRRPGSGSVAVARTVATRPSVMPFASSLLLPYRIGTSPQIR